MNQADANLLKKVLKSKNYCGLFISLAVFSIRESFIDVYLQHECRENHDLSKISLRCLYKIIKKNELRNFSAESEGKSVR